MIIAVDAIAAMCIGKPVAIIRSVKSNRRPIARNRQYAHALSTYLALSRTSKCLFIAVIGLARATAKIGLMNLRTTCGIRYVAQAKSVYCVRKTKKRAKERSCNPCFTLTWAGAAQKKISFAAITHNHAPNNGDRFLSLLESFS